MLTTLALALALQAPVKMPIGNATPNIGNRCAGSNLALGTSDLGGNGSGSRSTTVVNMWSIATARDGVERGYIVKTRNGGYWLEPDVDVSALKLSNDDLRYVLSSPKYRITGCFTADLPER